MNVRAEVQALSLAAAITAGSQLTEDVKERLRCSDALGGLGIEVMDLAILAVKPRNAGRTAAHTADNYGRGQTE